MTDATQCPKCNSEHAYQDRDLWVCPECAHEWSAATEVAAVQEAGVRDAHGNALADGDSVGVDEFPHVSAHITDSPPVAATAEQHEILAEYSTPLPSAPAPFIAHPPMPTAAPAPVDALALLDAAGDVRPLEEIEGELIRYAVSHYRGQMSEVARRLRIGRSTLYRKLESLGLESDGADSAV